MNRDLGVRDSRPISQAECQKALRYFCKELFHFEIIINDLVSTFCFVCILMFWVYCHYKYPYSYGARIDFRRQNLTSKIDPRAVRVKEYFNKVMV